MAHQVRTRGAVLLVLGLFIPGCGGDSVVGPTTDPVFTGTWEGSGPGGRVVLNVNNPVGASGAFDGCVRVQLNAGTLVGALTTGTLVGQAVELTTADGGTLEWTFVGAFAGDAGGETLTGQATGLIRGSGGVETLGPGSVSLTRSATGIPCGPSGN